MIVVLFNNRVQINETINDLLQRLCEIRKHRHQFRDNALLIAGVHQDRPGLAEAADDAMNPDIKRKAIEEYTSFVVD